jgi:hypothetical protein
MILLTPIEKLPDRPSALIRIGLNDLAECERDPRYRTGNEWNRWNPRVKPTHGRTGGHWEDDGFVLNIMWNDDDMPWDYLWHRRCGDICLVCLAGAMMAKSCLAPWGENYTPDDFDEDCRRKLMTVDALRQGHIHRALIDILGLPRNPLDVERRITPYAKDRRVFFRQMTRLADDLEAHDL